MKIQRMICYSLNLFILFFNICEATILKESRNFILFNSFISFEISDTFMFYLYKKIEEIEVFEYEFSGSSMNESKEDFEKILVKVDRTLEDYIKDESVSFILILKDSNSKHYIKSLEFVTKIQDMLQDIPLFKKNDEELLNQKIENIWVSSAITRYLTEIQKITSKANTRNQSPLRIQSHTENPRFLNENSDKEFDSDLFFIKYIQQWEFVKKIKLEFLKKLFWNTEITKILSDYLKSQITENPNTNSNIFVRLEKFLECNFEKLQDIFSKNINSLFDTTFSAVIHTSLESNLYENCFYIGNNIILLNNNHTWLEKKPVYIFDIDSTLYSSETGIEKRIKYVISNLGEKIGLSRTEIYKLSQKYKTNHGGMVIEMMKNPTLTDEILDLMIEESLNVSDSLTPDINLKSLLTAIKHPKICFTNGTCGHAIRTLKALGIFSCFDAIVFCNYKLKDIILKPRIESYTLVEYFLNIEKTNIIFYDDSKHNIEMAKCRGWKTYLVENNIHQLLLSNI